MKTQPCMLTVISSHTGRMTKYLTLEKGQLKKDGGTKLVKGSARVERVPDLDKFAKILNGLSDNEALSYGVPRDGLGVEEPVSLLSRKEFEKAGSPASCITRTRHDFSYSNDPGIVCIDHDPPKGSSRSNSSALSPDELVSMLTESADCLNEVGFLQTVSSSSCIFVKETGEELAGIRGQRIYLIAESGMEIPDIVEAIHKRFWLAGYGYIEISKSGQLLERSPIDRSTAMPEHLDYAAPPVLGPALIRNKPEARIFEGRRIRLADVGLTQQEENKYRQLVVEAKNQLRDEASRVHAAWADENSKRIATERALDPAKIRTAYIAANPLLGGNIFLRHQFELETGDGLKFLVEEVFADPVKWHECELKDPLEPDYDGGRTVAMLFTHNKEGERHAHPLIHSFAHGGQKYELLPDLGSLFGVVDQNFDTAKKTQIGSCPPKKTILYTPESLPDVVRKTQAYLTKDTCRGHIFNRGGLLSYIEEAAASSVTELQAARRIGKRSKRLTIQQFTHTVMKLRAMESVDFERPGKKVNHPIACPSDVVQGLLDKPNLAPTLTGLLEVPTITPDGRVLNIEGYDAATGLFVQFEDSLRGLIPQKATREDAQAAIKYLGDEFFEGYPFETDLDRVCAIALLLTAFVRRFLKNAPGFMVTATTQASGKSALVESVFYAVSGRTAPATSWSADQEEMRKLLLSILLEGHSGICFDNLPFGCNVDGDELAKLLTQEIYSARVLGTNRSAQVNTNVLVTITGNQLAAVNDMPSRLLPIALVPEVENPDRINHKRRYLHRWLAEHRPDVVRAVNTLFLAWHQSGEKENIEISSTRFPDWDDAVRKPLAWLGLPDVADIFDANRKEDPYRELRGDLLRAWYTCFGSKWLSLREVHKTTLFGTGGCVVNGGDTGNLREAIQALINVPNPTTTHLGNNFRLFNRAVFDGLRLVQKPSGSSKSKKARPWRVEVVGSKNSTTEGEAA